MTWTIVKLFLTNFAFYEKGWKYGKCRKHAVIQSETHYVKSPVFRIISHLAPYCLNADYHSSLYSNINTLHREQSILYDLIFTTVQWSVVLCGHVTLPPVDLEGRRGRFCHQRPRTPIARERNVTFIQWGPGQKGTASQGDFSFRVIVGPLEFLILIHILGRIWLIVLTSDFVKVPFLP